MRHIVSVLGFGWTHLRRYWVRLACGILCGVLFGLANGSIVWATKTLAGRYSPGTAVANTTENAPGFFARQMSAINERVRNTLDPWLPRADRPLDGRQVIGLLLFLPLLMMVRGAADFLSNYCISWASERAVRDLRVELLKKLSALSLDFFTRSSSGELLTRLNVDAQNLLVALRGGGPKLITETATMLAVFGSLLWLDWKLTLGALVLMPLCAYPLMVLGKKARRAMRDGLRANVAQTSQMVEWINGIRVIKAYGLEAAEIARFEQSSNDLLRAGMKNVQAREMLTPVIEIVSVLGLGLLVLYSFQSGGSGAELMAFLAGLLLLFYPVKKLGLVHMSFEQASVGVGRLREIFQERPGVVEAAQPRPLPGFTSAIRFDHVTFGYREKTVLRDVTLDIPRGQKLGVAGESGSGKTTLVNLLFRFYDPTSGVIRLDGRDLRELALRDLRRQMALVSQDVVIFDQTIAENIARGREGATREEVIAAAKAAFAHEFIQELAQGYDTRVGERGATLSGGQRQRVAIARAFVRDAPILVLDEATASLDSKTEAEVQAAIDRLAENRTVICVAHRLSTLATMDQIIVLSEGQIVESGRFEELVARKGRFADMAARQGIVA